MTAESVWLKFAWCSRPFIFYVAQGGHFKMLVPFDEVGKWCRHRIGSLGPATPLLWTPSPPVPDLHGPGALPGAPHVEPCAIPDECETYPGC